MKALAKILGLVVFGLLLIIVALGFVLTHFFDPNDYKDEIQRLAREKAGVELTIDGDIGWSLFPWLGLELHDTTVASARTPDQPLADLRMLGLSVRVMPLLRREIQMSDITVDGLDLTLRRDAEGRGNWEGIGEPLPADSPQASAEPAPAQAPREPEQPARNDRPMRLDIDSLTVRDARVSYEDARTGNQYSAEGIELTTGAIRENTPIPVKLSAFFGSNKPVMRARAELTGTLRFDNALRRYLFDNLKLAGEASGEPLNGETLNFTAQGALMADLAAQVAEWNGLKFTANQLRGLGELKLRDLQGEPKLAGTLSIAQFNAREFLQSLGQPLPAMADEAALGKVELVGRLAGTADSLALEELKLQIDDTTLTGRVALADLETGTLQASLKGDRIVLDRYLPPPSAADAAEAQARAERNRVATAATTGSATSPLPEEPTANAWSSEDILPVQALRGLDGNVSLNLDQLSYRKLPLEALTLKAKADGGLLTLETLRANLFGGRLETTGTLDTRQALPLLDINERMTGVPIERLLTAFDQKPVVHGILDLTADLQTRGNSQQAWVDNLDGRIDFVIDNGVLVDANLEQQLCQAIATLNRKTLTTEPRGRDTPFRTLRGSLVFNDGVATNPDLRASIPGLTVNGRGDLDLRTLGMDYRVGIVIEGDQGAMPDPACQVNERYVGLEWPLRCRGPLELGARACRLDKDGLGKIAAKLAGDKLTEKIEEELGDKVSPELKDALKGLFDR